LRIQYCCWKYPDRMSMSKVCVAFLALCLCMALPAAANGQTTRKPVITGPVDSGVTVVLQGSRHPLAQPRFNVGAVDPGLKMTRVMLVLAPAKETQSQLQTLLDHQQDRTSPDYHRWLTPEQFGQQFGPAPQDLLTVQGWLAQQGLQVTAVAKSGLWIEVSGTSGQIERAFQTQMRQYQVGGEMHIANATNLSIPAALAPVVSGVVSLHNFFKKPLITHATQAKSNGNGTYSAVTPDATLTGNVHAITPGDYAKIYDLSPLYNAAPTPLTGAGVQIGLVARNDISPSDFSDFRSITNLPLGSVTNVLTGPPDPGFDPNSGDTVEATLDSQWAGGVAPGASIKIVVSASTATTDGVDLSSAFAVDNNLTDILSVSFGQCEAGIGPAENAFYNSLWQQAAAQGMSVFVSSGDNGAAGCDPAESNTAAQGGLAVSGLASTPFNTAVGGTQFNEAGNNAAFWSVSNAPGGVSVGGYIPEMVWNESCNPLTAGSPCAGQGFFLDSGSGGRSTIYTKPIWQQGITGMPADATRDIPDVSLTAAGHDGYVICFDSSCASGQVFIVGGTSASSPSFAGIMAIVVQALGRQGLPNYTLYRLARNASAFCSSSARVATAVPAPAACIFNDVTVGNNSVPGLTGFSATSGYDLATGLGSVNAANLVNAWKALATATTSTTLAANGVTTVAHGQPVSLSVSVTGPNAPSPTGAVALSGNTTGPITALPLVSPAGTNVATFSGNVSNLPGGTYSLEAHYPGDSLTGPSDSNGVAVTVTPEGSATTLTAFGITPQGFAVPATSFSYGSFMDLHATVAGASGQGIPSGNIAFTDATAAQSLGTVPLNLKSEAEVFILPNNTVPAPLTIGSHTITASYGGDASFNASAPGSLGIVITKGNPSVVINPVNNFVATQAGTLNVFVNQTGPILPTGTVQFLDGATPLGAPVQLAAGSPQAVLNTTFPNEGPQSITASYSGDVTYNAAVSPALNVNVIPPFGFQGTTTATVVAGQTATYNLTLATSNAPTTFNGTVNLACTGAPAGTTCTISPSSIALSPTSDAGSFTVTVATTTSAALHKFPFRGLPIVFGMIFAIAISLKSSRKQRWQLGFVAMLVIGISSCGGGGGSTGSPAPIPTPTPTSQHTVVVTGTSGTHVNVVNLSLSITH
jgi:hypothetical protein